MANRRILAGLSVLFLAAASSAMAAGCMLGKLAELPVTMEGLIPTVPVRVDGTDLKLIADSGGFYSLLTPQATARAKLRTGSAPNGAASITGLAGTESARLATAKDFSLAGHTFHGAEFLVAGPQLGSEGVDGLLGDNILSYADLEFDLANGEIRLFRPIHCGRETDLAYWTRSGVEMADITPASAPSFKIVVSIKVNGHDMRAVLDSGAGRSFITRAAAREAGVLVDAPGVKPAGIGGGFGHHGYQTWIARFDSFAVGDELIKNAMLRVGDTNMDLGGGANVQMLIGADFLLSHRVYVANSEGKLYFTYNGGPVFNLDEAPDTGAAPAQPAAGPAIPSVPTDKPADADGFERRAAAFDARHEYAAAIDDYTQAIALQPTGEHAYYARAVEHWRNKEPDAALADLTAALKLKPDDDAALMARGRLRLQRKDEDGAAADFDAAAKIKPTDRFAAAIEYQQAQLFEKSIGEWDEVVADTQKGPVLALVLNDRCWTRALWGKQLDVALADCSAAIQQVPGENAFHDSRGLVYLRLGQYQASIADYDAALKGSVKHAWSFFGRAVDELRLGRAAQSQADMAAAIALDPSLPDTAKKYGITP